MNTAGKRKEGLDEIVSVCSDTYITERIFRDLWITADFLAIKNAYIEARS